MSRPRHLVPLLGLLLASAYGCGQDLTGPDAVDRVELSPASANFTAVGETEQFSARAVTSSGESVREITLDWSTADRSVATVDASGTVTAAGNGTTSVQVTVEDARVSATAQVTVDQQVEEIAVSPDSATITAIGAMRSFELEATDANGNPVSGVSPTWSSTEASVATIDASGEATAESEGRTDIVAAALGREDTATLVVDQQAHSVSLRPDSVAVAADDTVLVEADAVDAAGNPVPDPELSWTSSDSSIVTVSPVTDTTAEAVAVGSGNARVAAEAPNGTRGESSITVGANVAVSAAFVTPRGVLESSSVDVGGVVSNTGTGTLRSVEWAVRRADGTELSSGTISRLEAGASDSIPPQTVGSFSAGTHDLTLEVDPDDAIDEFREDDNRRALRVQSYTPGYDIELQFVGQVSDSLKAVTRRVRDRWSRIVTSDLRDVSFQDSLDLSGCTDGAGKRGASVDDMLLLVRSDSIDGEGGALARAGPCFVRTSDTDPGEPPLPIVGAMEVDSADVDNDLLPEIVLHEIAHALGFGTLWDFQGGDGTGPYQLLEGAQTSDPVLRGALGIDQFLEVGGDAYDGRPVPVANQGGPGTRDSHWRESVFDDELMTGFINLGDNPLSVVSIGSLADLFYAVDLGEADAYQLDLSGSAVAGLRTGRVDLGDDLLGAPVYGVTPSGRVRLLRPARRE